MIFVFGSNKAGRHGKGAALYAREYYGAEYGVGEGRTGNSYAIPTKDENLRRVSRQSLADSVNTFLDYANGNPREQFLLTPIGLGLAGFDPATVAGMLEGNLGENVFLSPS